jgi:hypothetical protein
MWLKRRVKLDRSESPVLEPVLRRERISEQKQYSNRKKGESSPSTRDDAQVSRSKVLPAAATLRMCMASINV